jgi:hypothetical protein
LGPETQAGILVLVLVFEILTALNSSNRAVSCAESTPKRHLGN